LQHIAEYIAVRKMEARSQVLATFSSYCSGNKSNDLSEHVERDKSDL
jgi:hypothetical protein